LVPPFPFFHLRLRCVAAMSVTLQWKTCNEA
jgi:hypothetical protein